MFKRISILMLALASIGSVAFAGATVLDYLAAGDSGTTGFVTANFTKATGFDIALDYMSVFTDSATPTISIYENGNFGTAVRTIQYSTSASAYTQFNNGVFFVTSSPNVTQVDVVLDGTGGAIKSIVVGGKAVR